PDRMLEDPFGNRNVRANMHPGFQSPDVTGPSGPVDPQLSLLAVETPDGKPLALMANYSMHYQGSPMLSSDYFGRFTGHMARLLKAGPAFTAIMSQGTSGDLWSGDYSSPATPAQDYDAFALEIAERTAAAYQKIEWHDSVPLAMEESILTFPNRVPDPARVAWAQARSAALGDKLPENQPDIYALESLILDEQPTSELKLQAIRIGELGLTGIPNEVFCLTGLKLKARSPFANTMNISLANGAEGYIPTPEQHVLGGYTTWPCRTSKLEAPSETRITAELTKLLEKVSGRPSKVPTAAPTGYSKAVLGLNPSAFWRLEEMESGGVADATGHHPAASEPGVVFYLPGHDEKPRTEPRSRAYHFAGGRLKTTLPLGKNYSTAFWLWNGMPADARPISGYAWSRGRDGDPTAAGEHLGIGGTHDPDSQGRLILFNGNTAGQVLKGRTKLALKAWHHVVLVREGDHVRVHLDGHPVPDLEGELPLTLTENDTEIFLGGRCDHFADWEGKIDEPAIFPTALDPTTISKLYQSAGQTPPVTVLAPEFPPLSPAEGLKSIQVPAGFKASLAAAEPLTMDPVAIDWDSRGRLWVVEMADYPSGLDNAGKPGGRVRILTDTDHDGTYETSTLFAEGLNFPTGLLTWQDGVFITAAPDLLFLSDTDGDGRADSTEKVISGLTEGNQQLRANGLRFGLDNRIYCAAGGHHGDYGTSTVLRSHRAGTDVKTGSRDFSFDPFTGDLRAESGPSQFGRNRDDAGHWYGTQNSRALWQYVLADPYLERNPWIPAPDPTQLLITPLNAPVYPVSPPEKRFHSFENTGHFTSACSGMIYQDLLLFPSRPGEKDAFTCEPFHNLVQHNILTESGVVHTARRVGADEKNPDSPDFFASTDRWCRPVMARTGPDGALWVVDMYRCVIEHPDWLPENARAELLPNYRLGEDKGRIYRIVRDAAPAREIPALDSLTDSQLLETLSSPNGWLRDKAQMILLCRHHPGAGKPIPPDLAYAFSKAPNALARLHLMCLLRPLNQENPAVIAAALMDESPAVRENAVRLAEGSADPAVLKNLAALTKDPSPAVRLQLALSLGNWTTKSAPGTAQAADLLAILALQDGADPWMRAAVMSSALPHCRVLCRAVASAAPGTMEGWAGDLTRLAIALKERDALAELLRPVLTSSDGNFTSKQFVDFAHFKSAASAPGGGVGLERKPGATADELTKLLENTPALLGSAAKSFRDPEGSGPLRAAAAEVLLWDSPSRRGTVTALLEWLAPSTDRDLQLAAIRLLAGQEDGEMISKALIHSLAGFSPSVRAAAMEAVLGNEAWALDYLEAASQDASLAPDAMQRARLNQHPSEKVRELATKKLGSEAAADSVYEQYRGALALTGSVERGREIFQTRCTACHPLDGQGTGLGPDLKSVAAHAPEKILTNIINPSLDVQPGFFGYDAQLKDGSLLYGLVISETGNSVTMKFPSGDTRLIGRRDLAALKSTGRSLMPVGMAAGMTDQDMADLIGWLKAGR
ncbi:MAG: putative rane-bound dehydrogenase, partial [Verrucomicrobiales bacterium]|nr:putative rane-bound dehydrogenase [Verrucomicrobiales bacterium]